MNDLPDRMRRRISVVFVLMVGLAFGGLFGKLIHINLVDREMLLARAEAQRQAMSNIPARRGMILDTRGRIVATSEQSPDVFVDPVMTKDVAALAAALGPPLNMSPATIQERLAQRPDSRFVVIAKSADSVTAEAVRSLRLGGVGLSDREIRKYPLHESMAHVVGWVGRDRKGLEGIELQFDQHLRGRDGKRGAITDARRRAIGRSESDLIAPEDGGHVVLTIDAEIQRIVEDRILRAMDNVRAQSGVGIVMNPYTGEILAMACLPNFDANLAASASADLRRNRVITDPTEPGSTFKPFIACGALDGRHVNSIEKIDCLMGKRYIGRRLIKDTKPSGLLDLTGIIAKSSNIGMGIIAERMGNPLLHDTIRGFGFGQATGIEFPGEDPGVVYSLPKWSRPSTQSVAMGYEIMVTPLQLARAFSAIVNDGVLVRPRLVKQLLSPSGEVIWDHDGPEPVGRAVSADVARFMAGGPLLAVVEEGGKIKSERYTILGKTGTAKLMHAELPRYDDGAYLGTFVGAAPASRPELVALVMIRRPDPALGYYGSATAGPAVAAILDQALSYLGIAPDKPASQKVATRSP